MRRRARGHLQALRVIDRLPHPLSDALRGISLGLLDPEDFAALDEAFYDRHLARYVAREGLFDWERPLFDDHLPPGGRVLVAAAGSGRELAELTARGFRAEGFESHPGLRAAAREPIAAAERDHVPALSGPYDAIVVGWGAYMCIPGAATRIAFLRALRPLAAPGAPLVASFFPRQPAFRVEVTAAVAKPIRRLRRAPPPELGDTLTGNFVHCFAREEIASELAAGGFSLVHHGTAGYGYIVARA